MPLPELMRITEQTRYALRVLAACAQRYPNRIKVSDLSRETGITEFNIFKLMKTIARNGLVETTRGNVGGVRLALPPEQISIGRVVRMLEPRFQTCGPAELFQNEGDEAGAIDASIRSALGSGIHAFLRELDGRSISELI